MIARCTACAIAITLALGLIGCATEEPLSSERQAGVAPATIPVQQESATPTPLPEECSGTLAGSIELITSIEELAWTSHQVILGTVVERQPPVWGDAYHPTDLSRRLIYTHYVVGVEQRLRGQPGETILVRQWGGTIGSCTQTNTLEHPLSVGERVLLFLRESSPPGAVPTYSLNGGDQGRWVVNPNGTVTTTVGHLQRYDRELLTTLIAQVDSTLAGLPPDTPGIREHLVPLDVAPALPAESGN